MTYNPHNFKFHGRKKKIDWGDVAIITVCAMIAATFCGFVGWQIRDATAHQQLMSPIYCENYRAKVDAEEKLESTERND